MDSLGPLRRLDDKAERRWAAAAAKPGIARATSQGVGALLGSGGQRLLRLYLAFAGLALGLFAVPVYWSRDRALALFILVVAVACTATVVISWARRRRGDGG